jgi:hypothetical protein
MENLFCGLRVADGAYFLPLRAIDRFDMSCFCFSLIIWLCVFLLPRLNLVFTLLKRPGVLAIIWILIYCFLKKLLDSGFMLIRNFTFKKRC